MHATADQTTRRQPQHSPGQAGLAVAIAALRRDLERFRALNDDDLVGMHDAAVAHTAETPSTIREELARREDARKTAEMLSLTKSIKSMTYAVVVLTAVNVALVVVTIPLALTA